MAAPTASPELQSLGQEAKALGTEPQALEKRQTPDRQSSSDDVAAATGLKNDTGSGEDLIEDEDSPYEEVRAAVRNTDPGGVCNTLRAWVLGMIFVTLGAGLNMFLSMRYPAINFPAIVIQLVVYPIGCLWAKCLPTRVFNTFGTTWTLNPGPFSIKEHAVITLMSTVSINYAYGTDALLALQGKPFYNLNLGWGFSILFLLSSQLIGIALSGLFRRFLVWPAAMMWPGQFATTSLFYALHDKGHSLGTSYNGWTMSRYRWFVIVTAAMFCYYWIPGVLFQALSVFSFVTWIRPNNVTINQLFGGVSGLSLIPITFDWTYVTAYLLDPLLAPTMSHINVLIGLCVFVLLPTIGIVYTGAIYSSYLPLVTTRAYDNNQTAYNVHKILTPEFTFNQTAYEQYSPLFLAPTYALNYGLSFAALTACIIHVAINHGKEIWVRFRKAREQPADIHLKLMKAYPEVPEWWYAAIFVGSLGLGLACVLAYPSQLPWWGFFLSVILATVFILPATMIFAVSNITLSLNVLSPFIAGFAIPGRPIAVMMFKVYSTITLGQAQTYLGDLKMAHYMKIPPRVSFWCQLIPSIWVCFVQIAVMNWTLGNIPNACDQEQANHFICPNGQAFFTSSIVWGVIGPRRMFGVGSNYVQFNWFWLLGAGLPVLLYILTKMFPKAPFRHLSAPLVLGGMAWLPPATPLSFSSWAIFGLIFNYWIRRRWNDWWRSYNYITAAALDAGLVLSTIIIFFAITLPDVTVPQWWGNTVTGATLDATFKAISKKGHFGPEKW